MFNKVLSDEPTIEYDAFGYQKAAAALTDIIVNEETETPFTIGIFGEWGTGKTTLLRMIEVKIQQYKNYPTIWFDPWRYDEKKTIQSALIQTILARMYEDSENKVFKEQIFELTGRFLTLIAAKTVEIGTSGVVKPFEIAKEAGEIIKPKFDEIRDWNKLEQTFAEVVKNYVGKDGRLVIIIDDLDRCLPENAIQVLEAIKLFLAQENCIFVLGVEKRGIEEAITLRYKDNPQMSGIKYLEKIVQLPFFLPQPKPINIENYAKKLLGLDKSDETQDIIKAGTGNNPRRIKRLINTLSLLRSIASEADLEVPVLAKIIMIQLQFPNIYQLLCSDPTNIDKLTKICETDKPYNAPDYNAYKAYFEKETEIIPFLYKTRHIYPKDNLWDSYFYLTSLTRM